MRSQTGRHIATERSLAAFNAEVTRLCKTLPLERVRTVKRVLALKALRGVVLLTPVDTGGHRARWQVSIGEPRCDVDPSAKDASGSQAIAAGTAAIAQAGPLDPIYISNNGPAIMVLELGGFVPADPGPSKDPRKGRHGRVLVQQGYSVQAPNGMVAVTAQRLTEELRRL